MRVLQLVEAQSARLSQAGVSFGHGTTNAFDEAAWLVQWALGLPLDGLDDHAQRAVSASERLVIEALVERRIKTRKPAAYLTNQAWLQGVAFHVDERVIVPRSFIAELLADASIDAWLGLQTRRVLDLCTGSGCLAVLAAMAWPEVRIDAADISEDALAVARINVDAHELQDRITLLRSDGLSTLTDRYDLILCNPPYVNADAMANLPPEYRAEPELALAGGTDGRLQRARQANVSEEVTSSTGSSADLFLWVFCCGCAASEDNEASTRSICCRSASGSAIGERWRFVGGGAAAKIAKRGMKRVTLLS